MPDHSLAISIANMKKFFDKGTSCFSEEHDGFAPKPGMFTVAQHVAHAAQVVEWFVDGAFSDTGMTTDFAEHEKHVRAVKTLAEARAWMDRAVKRATDKVNATSMADMMRPIAPGIMGGVPRIAIVESMAEHTAHHRGALAVYARLLNLEPPMPYM